MKNILQNSIEACVQATDVASAYLKTEKAWKKNSFNKRYAHAVSYLVRRLGDRAVTCSSLDAAETLVKRVSSIQAELYTAMFLSNKAHHSLGVVWERATCLRDAIKSSGYLTPTVGDKHN